MDIISELASALVGNIGLIYSANIGDKYAMFEPAHGSAPKYKGQYRVNPTAMILSAAWMLEYLGFKKHSQSIFRAVEQVIQEGRKVTYDLGGNASTLEMAKAIAELSAKYLDEL
jgi:isocitrate dehydrogenase